MTWKEYPLAKASQFYPFGNIFLEKVVFVALYFNELWFSTSDIYVTEMGHLNKIIIFDGYIEK